MDTAHHQWPQESVVAGLVKPMVEMVSNTTSSSNPNNNNNNNTLEQQRKPRPQKEQAINCPRCNSTNTKFCYYNNYSLTQPRYFCKTCRRYWTEGGSLRNVPVGGGSRKNRRSSSSSSILSSKLQNSNINNKLLPSSADNNHLTNPPMIFSKSLSSHQNPKIHETQDLNLAFPATENYHTISSFVHDLPNIVDHQNNKTNNINSSTTTPSTTSLSALLRSGISNTTTNSRGLSTSYMPTDHSNTVNYSSGFALQDFKPTLNFGIDGLGGGGYGNLHHDSAGAIHHQQQENSGRPLFPFEDLRQVSSTTHHEQFDHQQNRGQGAGDSNGYWSGMLGGGSW